VLRALPLSPQWDASAACHQACRSVACVDAHVTVVSACFRQTALNKRFKEVQVRAAAAQSHPRCNVHRGNRGRQIITSRRFRLISSITKNSAIARDAASATASLGCDGLPRPQADAASANISDKLTVFVTGRELHPQNAPLSWIST
jgi:hypothetical protein